MDLLTIEVLTQDRPKEQLLLHSGFAVSITGVGRQGSD